MFAFCVEQFPFHHVGGTTVKMDRRDFLKKAGLGSIALGSLPVLAGTLTRPVWAANQVNFRFISVSQASTVVKDRVNISGDGKVTPAGVVGGGSFNIFDTSTPVPRMLVLFGTWKAKNLISFGLIGKYGALAAGVLEIGIDLIPVEGPVTPATLRIACSIVAGGLDAGEPEGATLTIPGAPFGPFTPIDGSALSIFTTGVEERN